MTEASHIAGLRQDRKGRDGSHPGQLDQPMEVRVIGKHFLRSSVQPGSPLVDLRIALELQTKRFDRR
jgi:hypothetical protein